MIQDKIFFDEKDPTGLSYNTPFTVYGSYEGRLWSKTPSGEIKYYTQNSDLSVYATTGSNSFNGNQTVTGSLTVTEGITGTATTASYVQYSNVADKPSGIVSSSVQVRGYNVFATTGSNQFNGSQSVTGSLTVTGQVIAQTLNVQEVTSSIVFSSGSNRFGNNSGNKHQFTGSLQVTGSNHHVSGYTSFYLNNNTAGNANGIRIEQAGTGDSAISFLLSGVREWLVGIDNSDSDTFKINNSTGGSDFNNVGLSITTTGAATFGSSVTAVNAILSGTGNAFADGLRINRNSNTNQYTVINHLGGATNIVSVDQSGNNIAEIYFGRSTNGSTISNSMMINASGNVGIGTSSALQTLTLAGTQMMYNTAGDGNTNTIIGSITSQVRNYGTGIATSSFASIQFATDSTTWFKGDIRFLTNGSDGTASAGTERLRITSGGLIRITNFTSNGLVGTDAAGNLGVVNNTYTEIPTGTISYSMTAGSPWAINNSFPATIRDFNDDAMVGSGDDSTGANQSRGVTFDLGSAKAVRKIVERGYPTKNLNVIVVQYSTDNSNWTEIHAYKHVYGNTQKDMEFNPTGAIAARYWRWFIDSWTTRETQNYYTYESIIYT